MGKPLDRLACLDNAVPFPRRLEAGNATKRNYGLSEGDFSRDLGLWTQHHIRYTSIHTRFDAPQIRVEPMHYALRIG